MRILRVLIFLSDTVKISVPFIALVWLQPRNNSCIAKSIDLVVERVSISSCACMRVREL